MGVIPTLWSRQRFVMAQGRVHNIRHRFSVFRSGRAEDHPVTWWITATLTLILNTIFLEAKLISFYPFFSTALLKTLSTSIIPIIIIILCSSQMDAKKELYVSRKPKIEDIDHSFLRGSVALWKSPLFLVRRTKHEFTFWYVPMWCILSQLVCRPLCPHYSGIVMGRWWTSEKQITLREAECWRCGLGSAQHRLWCGL